MELLNYIIEKPKDTSIFKVNYKKNNKLNNIPKDSYPIKCLNGIFLGINEDEVITYKGIPFAKPPIKNLRWHPPESCENSDNIYEAYYFQKCPIQSEDPGETSSFYEISEDCLYLNIWKNNDNLKNKPVMVFIHGGAFGWGGTIDPLYDGHNFVKDHKDIILVTITYRVSILGFLDLTQIKGGENFKESPNLGLLDQIQALKWINQNIENFGGDKNNITIFGESAGGCAVTLLPLIKGNKGLFKRIISQSGTFTWCINRETGKSLVDKLKNIVSKKKKDFDVNFLMNLSEKEIIELNQELNIHCLPPMRDGYILPENCFEAIEKGAYNGIDILIGSNQNEINYWIIECGYYFLFKIFIKVLVENIIKFRLEKDKQNIFEKYQKIEKESPNENFLSDLFFRVPASKIAELHSKNKGNTYLYYWTYPSSIPNFGACHAVELSYIFNNLQETHYMGNKNINYKLAEISQEMWVNFAKTGNPSTKDYKWEKYDCENKNCMILGKKVELKQNIFVKRDQLIEPLIYKYIPYDYSTLSLNVPIIRKSLIIFCAILILFFAVLIIRK